MKISEVCKKTELSERAVRLYVEKGLILPASQYVNGRTNLEFSNEDVERLQNVSVLRKAGFSIADILNMQKNPDAVKLSVLEQAQQLEQEQNARSELIRKLRDVATRGNISWEKLANVLEKNTKDYKEQKICFPLEQIEHEEEDKTKSRAKKIIQWFCVILVIITIFFIFDYNKRNQRKMTAEFYIQEVFIDGKWKREDCYYISVYSLDVDGGFEERFKSPRTMQVSREYYEAFRLDGEAYDSFEVLIEISYADAKEENVLDEEGNISIEKILEKDRLTRDHCFVKKINNK